MSRDTLFTDINTSFNKQQNPIKTFELPCDREYNQMNLGSCSYFLLSEYPTDVEVYISLNPERKDAFKIDNRNTGFKINDVYSQQGVPSFVKDVYLWSKGITNLTEPDGKPKKIKIVTSGIPSFEILNNSSINSIESIGQIGSINGLVGYPQGAITICGVITPALIKVYPTNWYSYAEWNTDTSFKQDASIIDPHREYIISAKGILDPEIVLPCVTTNRPPDKVMGACTVHAHAGIKLSPNSQIQAGTNRLYSMLAKSYTSWNWVAIQTEIAPDKSVFALGSGHIDNEASYQFSGKYILENFVQEDNTLEFAFSIRQFSIYEEANVERGVTNTKLAYQISAYRTGN